jgi:predicted Zn-dependent protease
LTIPLAIFLLAGVGSSTIASEPSDRTLREEADRETERLSRIAKIHDEPALDSYLATVVSRLMAGSPLASDAPAIRVTVLHDVAPSAFMLPNARLFVHTGLLARLGNEAQLAAILARETVHLTAGHALRADRDAPDTSGQPVSSPLPAQGLPLTYTAAVTGYGRDLEREADAGGLTRVARAGYDPREALLAFERLREEPGQPSRSERYYLSNRARLDERLAGARKWLQAKTSYEAFTRGSEDYAFRTRLAVRENAGLEIRAGRYGLGRSQLDRVLALTPADPVAHLYYGDLHRLAAQRTRRPEDRAPLIEQAREAYTRAIALDPAFPDPFRQLGFLYYQTRDNPRAREAFERYLALNPDAPDARRVKEYLIELER